MSDGAESWTVLDDRGEVVAAVEMFLAHFQALDRSPTTVRAYAFSLKLWFVFLDVATVAWDQARADHVSRFVAWLRAPAANVVVLETGRARRSAATVNRHLAALFSFYDYQARYGVELAQALVWWRRSNRGGYKAFLHHVTGGRPAATRPSRLRQPRRLPRTLTGEQIVALVEACAHVRDRFLLVLLAETGMRIGQALGLRHEDFVAHRREVRIVPRADNANGARAKTVEVVTIPISAGLVRLYTAYMFDEYGELDSDYVFVNLFAEPRGAPMRYQAVNRLIGGLKARTGIDFTPHMLRHSLATDLIRRGVALEVVAKMLTHRSSVTTSQTYVHLDTVDLRAELQRHGALPTETAPCGATAGGGLRAVPGASGDLERVYAADVWPADQVGVRAPRDQHTVSFVGISQLWLRDAAKRWARQRLAINSAFSTVIVGVQALKRFSAFLAVCHPPVAGPRSIDRALLERYLAWLAPLPLADSTKSTARVFLRAFLEENRRHHWLEGVSVDAVIYPDELSARQRALPRFITEPVMAQLESEANLARLLLHYRHLVIVIAETGLRAGDACALAFDPILTDSAGWSCLRYHCEKMRAEQMIPLSARAVQAIRAQQDHVTQTWPSGSAWLFPARSDPSQSQSNARFRNVFARWQERIGLHDEAGRPVHVTLHQLRHTFGTRLINQGVPQHVIQRLLGHASPNMTALYAHLHDSTLRQEFERYCQSRVDIEGRLLGFDPEAVTANAEWIKHNLARAADTLPNGYCGRPPQQECPHPNACLTCPQFQTTVKFLPVHRQQKALTHDLIDAADAAGHQRLADNHRRVLANLDNIITTLENLPSSGGDDD